MKKTRYKAGFELISEVFKLSILAVKHNCFIIPNEIAKKQNIATEIFTQNKAKKYLTKYNNEVDLIANKNQDQKINTQNFENDLESIYKKYLLSNGLSFAELFAKCFKLDKTSFLIKINEKNDILIDILSDFGDDFLIKNKKKIEKKLSNLNKDFFKKIEIAKLERKKILAKSEKVSLKKFEHEIKIAKNSQNLIQKENFII